MSFYCTGLRFLWGIFIIGPKVKFLALLAASESTGQGVLNHIDTRGSMYYTRNSNSNVRKYYAYLIWRRESGDGEKFLTSEVSLKGLVKLLSDDKQERVRYQIRWLNTQTRLHTNTHAYSFALDLSYCLFSHTSSANDKILNKNRGWLKTKILAN